MKQPQGQKRLTNIATVRVKVHGLKFEATSRLTARSYKNTVLSWRNQIEKDLDNVLQSTTVYANVSKARRFTNVGNVAEPLPQGVLANKDDLMKAFGTRDEERVCLMILERGELQVSEKERKSEYETLFRDVVQVLVDKCVHPETGRPYTSGVLDRALRSVHFAVDPTRSAKQQALDALPRLQREFPIVRARMRFRVAVRREHAPQLRALLREQPHTLEGEEDGEITLTVTCTADPGCYRTFDAFTRDVCGGSARLDVLSLAVTDDGAQAELVPAAPMPVPVDALADELARARVGDAGGAPSALHVKLPTSSSGGSDTIVVYPRGPICALPDEHAGRRERFAELDALQAGWQVELRSRPGAALVEAQFFSPEGVPFKSFAEARRAGLKARDA